MTGERGAWAAVILLAVALRVTGLGYGLPAVYHQDEPIIVNHALEAAAHAGRPSFFVIPSLPLYIAAAGFGGYYLFGRISGAFRGADDLVAAYLNDPSALIWIGRLLLGVLPGVLTVGIVMIAARRMAGAAAALAAGLCLAVAPLAVQHSHYLYADALTTLFITAFLAGSLELAGAGQVTRSAVLGTGAALGLAAASKYNAVFFLPAGWVALWVGSEGRVGRFIGSALAMAGASAAAFAVACPYVWIDFSRAFSQILKQSGATAAPGFWHHIRHSLSEGTHPVFLIVAASGFLSLWVSNKRKEAAVLAVFLACGLVSLACFSQNFARYALPLVPALAILAGSHLAPGQNRFRFGVRAVTLGCTLGFMLQPTADYLRLMTREDSRSLCREWIEAHLPAGSRVARDHTFFSPVLRQDPEWVMDAAREMGADGLKLKKAGILAEVNRTHLSYRVYTLRSAEAGYAPVFLSQRPWLEPDLKTLRKAGVDAVIFNGSDTTPSTERLRLELAKIQPPVIFSPFSDSRRRSSSDTVESTAAPLKRSALRERDRLGPYLEVYRLSKGSGS